MLIPKNRLLKREREIIRLLNILLDKDLDFVVVGGYAIATYKKRFSVDLDLVIKEQDLKKIEEVCIKEGYNLDYDKDIELIYGEKFKRFTKKVDGLKVSIDFFINGLRSRTTDISWSFDYIKKHANKRKLDSLNLLIPEKELLIAMKFHSGRLPDIRDIVALMPCNIKNLEVHISKGNTKSLIVNMINQKKFLENPQFDDSFKGIFGIHAYNEKEVKETKNLVKYLIDNI